MEVSELSEQVAAMLLLAVAQAIDLRGGPASLAAASLHATIRGVVPRLYEDRRMDRDIAAVVKLIRSDALTPDAPDIP